MMRSYGQYCPVAKATEVVGDRWSLLIIREMLYGTHRFNELERGLPGIPRSLLAQRLRHLEREGVVGRCAAAAGRGTEYYLTPAGQQLQAVIDALGNWGAAWAFGEPQPQELDPVLLLWWMRRRVNFEAVQAARVVLQFDFHGRSTGSYWLVIEPPEVSVCLQPPGFDIDLRVRAELAAFYQVWFGQLALGEALRRGLVEIEGPGLLVQSFPRWFALSHFASAVRAALARTADSAPPATLA
ncbi:MAG TPA: winged helix-turn-helix transcriptional regulator [Chloroflexia bacterium]|nr:winged helix-turn-helix transcriptional regulator [Chloroflexia bacterium]